MSKDMTLEEMLEEKLEDANRVEDGIYDITNIPYVFIEDEQEAKALKFIDKHKEIWIAQPYDTMGMVLLAAEPKEIFTRTGTGFNYGSCNIITDCPRIIMILAEND